MKKIWEYFTPKKKIETPDIPLTSEVADTPATTQRLDSLMNIDTAFKKTRLIAILSLALSFLFGVTVMVVAMSMVSKGKVKSILPMAMGIP